MRHKEDIMNFGGAKLDINLKLKQIRKNMGLTQAQFADKAGFSRSTVSEYENGTRKITLDAIQKIATATNTNTSDWIEENSSIDNIDIKAFDGLKMVINALYESGQITDKGEMSKSNKELLYKMLEQEIPLYIACLKK